MKQLKEAIKIAAQIHEESYRDNSDTYEISIARAADIAAERVGFDLQGTEPVRLLLTHSWNEVLEWAEK